MQKDKAKKTKLNLFVAGIFLTAVMVGYSQPVITNQPQTQATAPGTTATFTVGASGAEPLTYQWQADPGTGFADLADRTNAVLTLPGVHISDQADYRVVVSDTSGPVTSAVAHLYVMSFAALDATTVLDNFDDNRLLGWDRYGSDGSGTLIESNAQFTVRGYWPKLRTSSTYDTFCVGALSASYRTVGQGQTVEWRVDLVQMDENATNAVKFLVGTTSGGYGLFKWRDYMLLDKYVDGLARLYTFDRASIPNTNVVVAFALTRAGPNVILTGRVLDKDNPDLVLYERSFVDTPGSDPTLTTADVEQLSGMHLDFSPEPSGAPYSYVLSAIGLFQYTDGTQPAATVTYDNMEVWTYRVPAAHYVDANSASPVPPYTNWATAASVIQHAVDAALPGDEIVVTNGIYATGGRAVGTNLLVNRVAVDKSLTLRSVNGPQFTVIQGYQVPGTTNGDGAIRCVYLTNGASLSGFTLTNGATRAVASGSPTYPESSGGGLWCESTNGVVSNCVLAGNSAYYGGGAAGGTLNNCTLTGNSATGDEFAGIGGGAFGATLNNCTLTGNSARSGGGAFYCTLNNCTLVGNSASFIGGGVSSWDDAPCTLNNCTLTGNSALREGGGARSAILNNCVIHYNTALRGANYSSDYCTLNYCCTTPMPASGTGNVSLDPQLASATHLSATSPCRGAGNAAFASGTDIDGEVWANPPSIGCDEYREGAATGPLSVGLTAAYTNVATDFPVEFTALIEGQTMASSWDFGDGIVVSNRPYTSHAWTAPGNYGVVLRACNESAPSGVSANVTIHVVAQPVHYVAADSANPLPPYASWATAATSIQEAVEAATAAGASVLVSNGVYATGGRAVHGTMTNRVAVDKPLMLRSVNGPQVTMIQGAKAPAGIGDGAVRCVYLASGASLSGFTLTHGATRDAGWDQQHRQVGGGGVWCESATAVISNCVLAGNSAYYGGGAHGGTLNNCALTGNSAGWSGGGAYDATLNNCMLTANSAQYGGGGAAQGTLGNCTLTGNSVNHAYGPGGGAWSATLNNCLLTGNSANGLYGNGGGASHGTLNNCTLTGNSARSGGGATFATLNNCIVYFNTAPYGANYARNYGGIFNYCCTTPMPTNGVGNITNAPLFVDYASGDLRLQSNSPCINAGLNACAPGLTDLDGLPRIVSGTVDVGAYEFQGLGSMISYAWLQQYGLPTDGSMDYSDSDSDSHNTWQEWRCLTDPTNARSVLRLLSAWSDGTNVTVNWQSVAGVNYFLERSTNLSAIPPFTLLAPNVPGQPDTTGYTDTNAVGGGPFFYSVGVGN